MANFSGYAGDRFVGLSDVIAGDPVDVLVGDYLAEISLAPLSAQYQRHPERGYIEYFRAQLRPHLGEIARRGLKLITNAGGFNPAALAAAIQADVAELGLVLSVAHVRGDDVLDRLPDLQQAGQALEHLATGVPLSEWPHAPAVANAYLGGRGITLALDNGADIVICGRVTDASLVTGPAAWWHGWADDQWNALAGAVVAGHVIECGPQAQGGNFSGYASLAVAAAGGHPGYPIAEIDADGAATITKHSAHPGSVTCDTVTAQLLYEIQGLRYLNPDVTVHLEDVRLDQIASDRVRITGVVGSPPPATTKVAIFAPSGWQTTQTVYVTAPDTRGKIAWLRAQLCEAAPREVDLSLTQFGVPDPAANDQWGATVAVRVLATAPRAELLDEYRLSARIGSLYLTSFPGYYTDLASPLTESRRELIEYWPALLDQHEVHHQVVLDSGTVLDVAAPNVTGQSDPGAVAEAVPAGLDEFTRVAPLGALLHARSGDKGGNVSLGVWTAHEDAWPWAATKLSVGFLRRLLPETSQLDIERFELPNLRAVLFIIKGLLGTGGSANNRPDQVGKAVGEYLLSRETGVPVRLLKQMSETS